jgi:hypothetical protein
MTEEEIAKSLGSVINFIRKTDIGCVDFMDLRQLIFAKFGENISSQAYSLAWEEMAKAEGLV